LVKFTADRPFADPTKAARRLLEIANTIEPIQDGRIHIEKINSGQTAARPNMASGLSPPSPTAGSGSVALTLARVLRGSRINSQRANQA